MTLATVKFHVFLLRAFVKHIWYVYVDLEQIFPVIYHLKKKNIILLRAGPSEVEDRH